MNNKFLSAAALSLPAAQMGWAAATVKAGSFTGVVSSEIDSTGGTRAWYRRPDLPAWSSPPPMAMDGTCGLTGDDDARPDSVDFACDLVLGTPQSDTHA